MLKRLSFSAQIIFARRVDDFITLFQRLDPRVYSLRLRVRSIEGHLSKATEDERLLIFIVFEKFEVPRKTLEVIEAFKSAGFKVLAVNNGPERHAASLRKSGADLVLNRNNVGKDFGGYQDATLYLYRADLTHYQKVVYANDSVIYPRRNLPTIIREFSNQEADFIAHSSVEEIHFHYQSFLFSCSNTLFNSTKVRKFWKNYAPLDRRRYMIRRGEVGLSKVVIRSGCHAKVLNTFERLFDEIPNANLSQIIELTENLPSAYRDRKGLLTLELEILGAPMKGQAIRMRGSADEVISAHGRFIAERQCDSLSLSPMLLVRTVFEEVTKGNPSHLGFSYFSRTSDCFVIKRDLAHRAGFSRDRLFNQIRRYYPEESSEIIHLLKAPSGNHHKGLAAIMFNQGMI